MNRGFLPAIELLTTNAAVGVRNLSVYLQVLYFGLWESS